MADGCLLDNNLPAGFQLDQPPQLASSEAPSGGENLPAGFELDSEKYGSLGQQAKAGLEGLAEGVLGPIAPLVETRVLGVDPEAMRGRKEENPWTHGVAQAVGFTGSMFTGVGEGALVAHAGEAATKALGLGLEGAGALSKIGSGATRAATEMALLQAGDETSKMIEQDPEQSLGSAAANVGLAGILGVVGGGAIGAISPLWKATVGDRAGQFLEDLKGRINYRLNTPDLVHVAGDELATYHKNLKEMADEVYGATGLKQRDIAKAVPAELNDKIMEQAANNAEKLQATIDKMEADSYRYPKRLVENLKEDYNQWLQQAANPEATPIDIFNATQELKQTVQGYSKFEKMIAPTAEEYKFVQQSKSLAHGLRSDLEDSAVWGKAADRQKEINKAFSQFLPALKDFESKFTSKIGGEPVVDMTKVQTLKNQTGKPSGNTRRTMLQNFLDSAEKYRATIAESHSNLGLENPFPNTSLSATHGFLGELSPGAIVADKLIDKGLANVAGQTVGGGIGAGVGSLLGHPAIGFLAGEHAIGPLMTSILPSIVKPMMENPTFSEGLKAAADYGISVIKGEKLFNQASKNFFRSGSELLPERYMPSDRGRLLLEKSLSEQEEDPQRSFGVGGNVAHYLPDHGTQIAATAAIATNYLNSLKPKPIPTGGILDSKAAIPAGEKANYNRALDIAQQPLIVLKHIKEGTLLPQDITTLKTIFPGAYQKMVDQLTHQMTEHLASGGVIPYKQRLGLSMFLGQPVDSTLSSQSMINIMTSASPPPRENVPTQKKSGGQATATARNKVAKGFMTPSQAAEARKIAND